LRIITVLNLFDRNPNAAERLVSQQEVNGWFDTAMEGSVAELFCKEDAAQVPRNISLSGTNLYANIGIQASANDPAGDPRPRLTTNQTPVLILYAECEYVPWEVALEYRTTFPQATLIYIDNAGHMINLSQPAVTYQVMRAFLLEESLPLPPYTESTPPG
jgi:proline iminopeptidase